MDDKGRDGLASSRPCRGRALLLGSLIAVAGLAPAIAQDNGPLARPAPVSLPADALYGPEELDQLVARVALYPDSLLAQVLVAATFPLDLVKADRWLAGHPALSARDRSDAAQAQPWDPSVQILAGGFPTVLTMLARDIDGTEALGDAVLAQTEEVLDAVQRMRSRAMSVGSLASNEAQTVATANDKITIAPAVPDVVQVPNYDPVTVYAPPESGIGTGGMLATGAIAFGSALLPRRDLRGGRRLLARTAAVRLGG